MRRKSIKYYCIVLLLAISMTACGSNEMAVEEIETLEDVEEMESAENVSRVENDSEKPDMLPEQQKARDDFFDKYKKDIESGVTKIYLESDSPSSISFNDIYVEIEKDIEEDSEEVTIYYVYKSANDSGTDLIKHYDCYTNTGLEFP